MTLSETDKKLLSKYVTNIESDIYCLRNLPPEVLAVILAYASRSPNSFRDNLLTLLRQKDIDIIENPEIQPSEEKAEEDIEFKKARVKARKFHKKWVVGYGHASVAEHADIKFALDNVSIVASKIIEDCRLASFTEKSTRYQIFKPAKYYAGDEILSSYYGEEYKNTAEFLFDEYHELHNAAAQWLKDNNPRDEETPEKAYENSIKAAACDIARYMLPAGTLTAIGVSMNAREAAWAITKFLSHNLPEINTVGDRMRDEGRKITPTLLKYCEKSAYLDSSYNHTELIAKNLNSSAAFGGFSRHNIKEPLRIIDYDLEGENRIIAALLYRHINEPYESILKRVSIWSDDVKKAFLDEAIGKIGEHDTPPRELEYARITTDVLIDFGAFRDIQRHRIATQTPQIETIENGFATPAELNAFGWLERFEKAMERAGETYLKMKSRTPAYARYIVPLAFRKRALMSWNIRELFYFIRLRSAPGGHISYRSLAWSLHEKLSEIYPLIMSYCECDKTEAPLARLKSEMSSEKKQID